MTALPIDPLLGPLCASLVERPNLVLRAAPGSGKTTRVPAAISDAFPSGKVIVLEPRRIAARSAAMRVARELGVRLGEQVGYRVRFDARARRDSRIEFVTEGLFVRSLQQDPSLEPVAAVVFDEFHERNLASDLHGLGISVGIYHPGWVQTDMGGSNADIDVETAARGLKTRFEALNLSTTGVFEGYDGEALPY